MRLFAADLAGPSRNSTIVGWRLVDNALLPSAVVLAGRVPSHGIITLLSAMAKFLIAGLGSIGRRHLRNLMALGERDIVLLRTHRGSLPEEELAGFPTETNIAEALQSHHPSAVVVSNPTALHLDVAIPAAQAGCAILLEKPISHSTERLELFRQTVARSGTSVLMGFQFRYHPFLLRARELIKGGRLGRIISARAHFGEYLPAWHPWEDYRSGYAARLDLGGGVLLTQCHSIDYLPWLVADVDAVWGSLAKLSDLDIDVEDTAEIGLRFEGGALGSLHLDYAQQPPSHRLDLSGTAGILTGDLMGGELRYYDVNAQKWEDSGLPPAWERNTMFLEEMSHFLSVVRGENRPGCTLEDGIRVMQIIEAAQTSNRSGRLISLR
jgi:predicted dehydrogenase